MYRGSFVAEDTGEASWEEAFSAVKWTFEGAVTAGNFTSHLHSAAATSGAVGLSAVTHTEAEMTLLTVEVVTPPDTDDGDDTEEVANSDFFSDMPMYGRWLFSLAMAALGVVAIGAAYYFELCGAGKDTDVTDKLIVDFDGIEDGSSSGSGSGSGSGTCNSDTGSSGTGSDEVGTTTVTPLEARTSRIQECSAKADATAAAQMETGTKHGADDDIVRKTSHLHLERSKNLDESDELSFGY